MKFIFLVFSLFLLSLPSFSAQKESQELALDVLSDSYLEYYFMTNPTLATASGIHTYDGKMRGCTQKEIRADITKLKTHLKKFEKINGSQLSLEKAADREILISHLKARLLELEHIKNWEKNPDTYSSSINEAVYSIMSRNFAPLEERLKSVISREREALKNFECAKANLRNPPRIYTEIAIDQLPGIISFFEKDVVETFVPVKDESLKKEFTSANNALIHGFEAYEGFLKETLLAKSKGDFRIGAENFRNKLAYEEMVTIPLPELLKIGMDNLRLNQEAFKETAKKIDPDKSPAALLAEMEKHHPAPDKVIDTVKNMLGGLKEFLTEHKIITVPSPVFPIVQETPPFMRALTFASMDTPGPFETKANEAFYNLTLPEPTWDKTRVEEHMAGYSYETTTATSIHEAYPGHYVQFLWMQQIPNKVRKMFGCNTNAEGWAHYTEQMILDEGYGKGDPKLRLGQLQDALLRNARFIVGIQMHTGKMTMEEAIDFFVKEGYQSRANGERETKRGTSDPTYLYYTLGKLEILKLREDYKKLKGEAYTLQDFHDTFMKQGFPPLKIVRRALLGKEAPVL